MPDFCFRCDVEIDDYRACSGCLDQFCNECWCKMLHESVFECICGETSCDQCIYNGGWIGYAEYDKENTLTGWCCGSDKCVESFLSNSNGITRKCT